MFDKMYYSIIHQSWQISKVVFFPLAVAILVQQMLCMQGRIQSFGRGGVHMNSGVARIKHVVGHQ